MPDITFSTALRVARITAIKDKIDEGTTNSSGAIKLYTAANTLLGTCILQNPCGTVDATSAVLTISGIAADSSADATGVASYATIVNRNGAEVVRAVVGDNTKPIAMPNTTITAGEAIIFSTITITDIN